MTTKEFIKRIAKTSGVTIKDTNEIVKIIFEEISNEIKNDGTVHITNFGKFYLKTWKPRRARHPITNEIVENPSFKCPSFSASELFRDSVNNKFEE